MICQSCGVEAPTKYVAFYQNIGALIMRFTKSAEGNMCKSCINDTFWPFTLTTLGLGWFGLISLIITPFLLLNNVIRYLTCLGMDPVPPGAMPPQLTDDAITRLQPLTNELVDLLNNDEEFERVVETISMKAGVTKGQVVLYVQALMAAAERNQ